MDIALLEMKKYPDWNGRLGAELKRVLLLFSERKNARHVEFLPLVGQVHLMDDLGIMEFPRRRGATTALRAQNARVAFTFVELLTVVAILSILAALVFPLVRNSVASGDQVACLQNLKTLQAGVMLFAADNNGQILAPNSGADRNLPQFRLQILPYLSPDGTSTTYEKYFYCRAALRARNVSGDESTITYGYNGSLGYPNAAPPRLMRLNEIAFPGKTVMIMDGRYSNPTIWNFAVGPGINRRPLPGDFVHEGKVNAVYIDGHVSTLRPEDLPADANHVFWDPKGEVQ